ncbi:MAG: CinA family protein [Treponema sp.]|nr:CinA family protein [Treponema sp.]
MDSLEAHAEQTALKLVKILSETHHTLAVAESCTAGLVSDFIARVSGASAVFWGSFVCYSPQAKCTMLGIDPAFLEQYGLVSRETAGTMAVRALETAGVSVAAAVTGLAGPHGDGSPVPVGTVWIAVAVSHDVTVKKLLFHGTRAEVRMQAAAAVLEELLDRVTVIA